MYVHISVNSNQNQRIVNMAAYMLYVLITVPFGSFVTYLQMAIMCVKYVYQGNLYKVYKMKDH